MSGKNTGSLGEKIVKASLAWELPLGTIRGHLDEPGPRFVDPYDLAERQAIQEIESKKNERNSNALQRN